MFLALDVGTKTIGVATSAGVLPVATAWFTLDRAGVRKDVARLISAVEGERHRVEAVIVGLPLEMDEAERRICRLARQVGDALAEQTGWPVIYQDERWTTIEARRRLETKGIFGRRQKETLDAEAAAVILEDWLSNRGDT
jgi:putative Holliday junction resolvase